MKKRILSLIIAIVIVISCVPTAFAERPIKVLVGGEKIATDVAPVAIDGRVLVPVRAVFEALGAKVDYITAEKKVVAQKGDTTVEMVIDSNIMKINGKEKTLDVPATVMNNRTLVPLRACGEAFGHDVEWNGNTRTAKIKIPVAVVVEELGNGGLRQFTYDANGNVIIEDWPYYNNRSKSQYKEKCTYDANDNVIYKEIYWEDGDNKLRTYTYNEYGEVVYESHSDGYWKSYAYDDNGNCIDWIDSNGHWERKTYDANNNLVYMEKYNKWDGGNTWESYAYDSNGNCIDQIDSNGYWSRRTYDSNNNLIYEESYSKWDGNMWKSYTYDNNGNCIEEIDSKGGWIKRTYDANNNLIYFKPSSGYWYEYIYDANGNEIFYKAFDGRWSKKTYDEAGRVILEEYHGENWGPDNGYSKITYDENGLETYCGFYRWDNSLEYYQQYKTIIK